MINITDEQKKLFYSGGNFKDYVLYFPEIDLIITNETIHEESVVIKQSICEEEELMLGGCIASSIEFEVSEIIQHDLTGLRFTATLMVNKKEDGTCDLSLPMGVYRVDSCKLVDDKDYKKVVAYDALYDASVDVSNWYETEAFPVIGRESVVNRNEDGSTYITYKPKYGSRPLRQFRNALLEHLGLSYIDVSVSAIDYMPVEKTIETTGGITGTELLKQICTIYGGFGIISRQGLFTILFPKNPALFPEETLYPAEDLYPEEEFEYVGVNTGESEYPDYRSVKYEEYEVQQVTCVTIRNDEEDIGTTAGEDHTNPYVISSNIFLYGKGSDELKKIGNYILGRIKGYSYRPNTTELDGLPYIDAGDVFGLRKRNDSIVSYVFARTLSGIQALKDVYESKGSEMRANEVSSGDFINQIKGKMLKIRKDVDAFSINLIDVEEKAESLLEMASDRILLQVSKGEGEEEKVVAMSLDGSGEETEFKISADNIFLEGETIDLQGKKVTITADNMTIDDEGNITGAHITGSSFEQVYTEKYHEGTEAEVGYEYTVNIDKGRIHASYPDIGTNALPSRTGWTSVEFEKKGLLVEYSPPQQSSQLSKASRYNADEAVIDGDVIANTGIFDDIIFQGYKLQATVFETSVTSNSIPILKNIKNIAPGMPIFASNMSTNAQPTMHIIGTQIMNSNQIRINIADAKDGSATIGLMYFITA